jgi:hypothetical protein
MIISEPVQIAVCWALDVKLVVPVGTHVSVEGV